MKKHTYRALFIWAVVAVALVYIYPTVGWMLLSPEARQARLEEWQEEDDQRAQQKQSTFSDLAHSFKRWAQFDRDRVLNLGLDLQGGIHMVIGIDTERLDPDTRGQYEDWGWSEAEIQKEVQQTVLEQIRRRVNDFEAKEPVIQALGDSQIQVQLPGEKDIERARRLITKAAVLNFHIVAGPDETVPVFAKIKEKFPSGFTPYIQRPTAAGGQFKFAVEHYGRIKRVLDEATTMEGVLPEDKVILFSNPPKPFEDQVYELYLVDKEPIASGEGLRSAMAIPDQSNPPYWQILFYFNNAAGAEFGKATEANIGNPMAIVVDNVVLSDPVIRDRITTSGQISGSFEGPDANDLAIALNSGSMKAPVHEEFTRTVDASLGADSVRKGVISAIAGIVLVGLFMLVYYMAAGVVALIALALNAVLIVAAMAYFGMTLTLPGIAGLILTIGMAVDANVLIYERIREELALGHALLTSIENGYSRATVTILDANVTTLIAAAVLMQFGTGPIEGFAVTLSVGVCSSVFTALVVSRAVLDFVVGRKLVAKLAMLSLIRPGTKIPFLQARKVAAAASLLAIVGGMTLFGVRVSNNDMFGVDFTQGTNITLTLGNDDLVAVGDVRVALAGAGFDSPTVQRIGAEDASSKNQFIIRVGDVNEARDLVAAPAEASPETSAAPAEANPETNAAPSEASPETAAAEAALSGNNASAEEDAGALAEATGGGLVLDTVAGRISEALSPLTRGGTAEEVRIQDEQTVGPAVGAQLRIDALKAMFYSLVFIVIYLTFRFELKFAVGAVVALTHDVLVTVGIFALLGFPITMQVVAALLTIIGYSLNDTIVVFDRIREDLTLYRGKGQKFIDILNMAINSTLSRTFLTSLTTLFVVVVLFLFGGNAINDFALALILGIVVGTYSSIFIASPVVYVWQLFQGKHVQPTDTGRGTGRKAGSGKTGGKGGKGGKGRAKAGATG